MSAPPAWPIPARLNTALVLLVAAAWVGLVGAAGRVEGWALAAVTLAFALLFQTNFALFHEASHLKLHPRPRWNRGLGLVCGTLFGMSAAMFEVTHWSHHLKNRTDQEMFDLYYPHQSRVGRSLVWYGTLCGLLWPLTLALSLGTLLLPGLTRRVAERVQIAERVFQAGPALVRRIRWELLLGLAAHAGLLVALGTPWPRVLLLYGAGAWLWSSSNYLEHVRAPRDVLRGAWNLRAPAPWSWINLHREWDLNHHLHPGVPWLHLPRLATDGPPRRSWLAHWLGQWSGLRAAHPPGPSPLEPWQLEPWPGDQGPPPGPAP